jgi:NitT/TauT family transport system ATP-binding protein
MKEEFFEELFMQHFSTYEVEKTMDLIIDWGRYAELFSYDYDSKELFIDYLLSAYFRIKTNEPSFS